MALKEIEKTKEDDENRRRLKNTTISDIYISNCNNLKKLKNKTKDSSKTRRESEKEFGIISLRDI